MEGAGEYLHRLAPLAAQLAGVRVEDFAPVGAIQVDDGLPLTAIVMDGKLPRFDLDRDPALFASPDHVVTNADPVEALS